MSICYAEIEWVWKLLWGTRISNANYENQECDFKKSGIQNLFPLAPIRSEEIEESIGQEKLFNTYEKEYRISTVQKFLHQLNKLGDNFNVDAKLVSIGFSEENDVILKHWINMKDRIHNLFSDMSVELDWEKKVHESKIKYLSNIMVKHKKTRENQQRENSKICLKEVEKLTKVNKVVTDIDLVCKSEHLKNEIKKLELTNDKLSKKLNKLQEEDQKLDLLLKAISTELNLGKL